MDFMNRGAQSPLRPAAHTPATAPGTSKTDDKKERKGGGSGRQWLKIVGGLVVLGAISVLIAVISMQLSGDKNSEQSLVKTDSFQAVDIAVGGANGGDQIYFGKITKITPTHIVLTKVYYIPANQSNQNSITLAQLVCQLDKPEDEMIINRQQLVYWENLQKDSKVVKSITEYEQKNPNGPNCDQASSSSAAGSSNTNTNNTNNVVPDQSQTNNTSNTKKP